MRTGGRQPAAAADRPQDGPLDQVIFHLGRAYYAYVGLLELLLAETGLDRHVRPGMGHILFALFEEDDRSIKDLAARVQLSGSTMTDLLSRMERGGLVARHRDDKDGRVVRVLITPLGRSLEPRCRSVMGQLNDVLSAGMGEQDVARTRQLLGRLIATVRAEERRRLSSRQR
jgi:DNA-binding MarR family transcriptional regulator